MAEGSNRKNLANQIGKEIPASAEMRLGKTQVATGDYGSCFTCKVAVGAGQRVRFCSVVGYVPAGFIHAAHFDAGFIGEGGDKRKMPRRKRKDHNFCKRPHRWSAWERAGLFDPTQVRTCIKCPAKETRRSKASR